ncbi:hypothetical protein BGZ65_010159 [Modicella reniformis]|uniref:Uncharacterized protein n=1 Tax=Modicella reniformis TaxID=1440133 RepID=A0A9P6SUR1_9FUNG|nr:hypothetical protein BGZ65_010159 [Modicella reniformis]
MDSSIKAERPLERVLAIAELWANVAAFLFPRQIRRLRLVSKRVYMACIPHYNLTLSLKSDTPSNIASDPHFQDLITTLRLVAIDQISPLLVRLLEKCSHITTLEINDFGLDVDFLSKTLQLCPRSLQSLAVRSDGFIPLQSMVEALLDSAVASHIQMLSLDIGATGLDETHSLPWSSFRSVLDIFSSLTTLSLGCIKIMDVPESLEEIDPLHATTMTFPNMTSLTLKQCDISGTDRYRLMRIFTNLKSLEITCRDTIFDSDITNTASENDEVQSIDQLSCVNLKRVNIRCTNSRSLADQSGLYRLLKHLPSLEALELSGFGTDNQELVEMAEEWTRLGVQLKHLSLNLNHRRVDDDVLERVLRQDCCSRLESLDAWFGPDLILRFWNRATEKSELPFLETLRSLYMRKEEEAENLQEEAIHVLNLALRQMPRLVDLVITTKLDDFAVVQGLGCDPKVPLPSPGSPVTVVPNWLHERPFLQTLAVGVSEDMFLHKMVGELPRQIGKRFRFLEVFNIITKN